MEILSLQDEKISSFDPSDPESQNHSVPGLFAVNYIVFDRNAFSDTFERLPGTRRKSQPYQLSNLGDSSGPVSGVTLWLDVFLQIILRRECESDHKRPKANFLSSKVKLTSPTVVCMVSSSGLFPRVGQRRCHDMSLTCHLLDICFNTVCFQLSLNP